jgi:hypothetical protein
MVLKKDDEFLEIETGVVWKIYHISKHATQLLLKSRKGGDGDFILHTNPRRFEEVTRYLTSKKWIPNTPAARALYVSER